MEFLEVRQAVASFLRRIYERHLTTTSGGNVSARCEGHLFAITPSATDKANVEAAHVSVLTLDGTVVCPGIGGASSEWLMHARVYQQIPSVGAIVHAHPPTASAFACSATAIRRDLMCETYALLDSIVKVPYARSGSHVLADRVAEAAASSSCLLLQNHGVVTLGTNLLEAFTRLELLEQAARITLDVMHLNGVRGLSTAEQQELDEYVGRQRPSTAPLDGDTADR